MSEPIRLELPTIFQMKTVNSWLFLEPEPTLIDCGEKTSLTWRALQKGLVQHGLKMEDIKRVIITHGHLDHMGLAAEIVAHSNAVVEVPEYLYDWAIDVEKMLNYREKVFWGTHEALVGAPPPPDRPRFGYKELGHMWDNIPAERLKTFPMEGTLSMGGQDWEIIYTPGHCVNQVCFYQPEKECLLSADMLLSMIPIPILDPSIADPMVRTRSLLELVQSYQKLQPYRIQQVLPGHFEPFEHGNELIDNQLGRILHRTEKCLNFIKAGHHTYEELLHLSYPNRIHNGTVLMTVGFLDILLDQGEIGQEMKDGKLWFYKR